MSHLGRYDRIEEVRQERFESAARYRQANAVQRAGFQIRLSNGTKKIFNDESSRNRWSPPVLEPTR